MKRYIDLDSAIRLIENLKTPESEVFNAGLEKAQWTLLHMHTEDVSEVIHGKWTVTEEYLICSECGGVSDLYVDGMDEFMPYVDVRTGKKKVIGYVRKYPDYCKRCGAKMDLKGEGKQ